MDADLQDDINVIDKMIEENNKGAEIVYGVRSSRKRIVGSNDLQQNHFIN